MRVDLLSFLLAAFSNSHTDDVSRLCDANRAAIDSLIFLKCRMKGWTEDASGNVSSRFPPIMFWRTPDGYRIDLGEGAAKSEVVVSGGVSTSLGRDRDGKPTGTITKEGGLANPLIDPRYRAILLHSNPGGAKRHVSLADLVRQAAVTVDNSTEATARVRDGIITVTQGVARRQFHVDSAHGGLISRSTSAGTLPGADGKPRHDEWSAEVVRFHQVSEGVWFPAETAFTVRSNGQIEYRERFEFSDVISGTAVGPVPPIRFPPGTRMTNVLTATNSTVGPTGEEKDAKPAPLIPTPPVLRTPEKQPPPGGPSVDEPTDASRYVIPVSLSLVVAGIALAVVRRRRVAA